MQQSLRQSMAWLHTWAGLLPGWLLYLVFLFGTAAFFQQEISRWMRPELLGVTVSSEALRAAGRYLQTEGNGAERWTITLPSDRGGEPLIASWHKASGEEVEAGRTSFDPVSGQPVAIRDTRGGFFLYRFHFQLHYLPSWLAYLLVSAAALAMLVAILSGIITHKKIFADFFMLRFGKGQRSWLDAHNVTAVLALPFQLMITYTGLATLLFTLMPWAISANFPDRDSYFAAAYPSGPTQEASGLPAKALQPSQIVALADAAWAPTRPARIVIDHPNDAASLIHLWPHLNRIGGWDDVLWLDGSTGEVVHRPSSRGPATASWRIMIDLHAGRFSGAMLRWLYFLSGVAGTIMVASGLVLWTVKRRAKLPDPAHPHLGFRLVERLNIGVIAGACAGVAIYFLANRLLPIGMANRADWEIHSLFIAWGAVFVWTLGRPAKQAWVEALAACAALYVLVPIVNALTTARGLVPSLIARDWVSVGFDSVMLAMAAACAFTAWKVATRKAKAAPRRRTHMLAAAAR
jgi:uncharacterized iron-regulated membrane protein